MNIIAQFEFEDKFQITGRGLVITGRIISGNFSSGNHFRFEENESHKTVRILGVEFGHRKEYAFAGLLLEQAGQIYFKAEGGKLIGKVFDIIE